MICNFTFWPTKWSGDGYQPFVCRLPALLPILQTHSYFKSFTFLIPFYFTLLFFFNNLFLKIFLCAPFLKSIEFVTILPLLFTFWSFGQKACGILAPPRESEPTPPALEGEVPTTGPQGKSLLCFNYIGLSMKPFNHLASISLVTLTTT